MLTSENARKLRARWQCCYGGSQQHKEWARSGWQALVSKYGLPGARAILSRAGTRSWQVQNARAIERGEFANQTKSQWGICQWPGCEQPVSSASGWECGMHED
jgi:hypothetical protein